MGEVFLNVVPFNFELKAEAGMSFDLFCKALLALAAVGYRDCPSSVCPADRVRALLLYMWKTVNDSDNKTVRKVTSSSRAAAVSSHAGSLNLFGSGQFSDQFLAQWVKDGFRDYTLPPDSEAVKADGVKMVKRLVGLAAEAEASSSGAAPAAPAGSESPVPPRGRTSSTGSVSSSGAAGGGGTERGAAGKESALVREALSRGGSLLKAKQQRKTLDFTAPHHVMVHSNSFNSSKGRKLKGPAKLFGADLQQLLLMKPELTEFLFLEIQNMKLTDNVTLTK